MRPILRYIKPYAGVISLTLSLKFIAAMMDLLIPSLLAKILNDVVPIGDREGIFLWGGVMIICAVASILTNVSANRTAARTSGSITRTIRHDLFERLSYVSSGQLDTVTVPSAVSRLTTDTYNLNQLFNRIQRLGVRAPILLVGGLAITLMMDATLTLVLLATLPFIALAVYAVTKKSVPLYAKQQGILDRMVRTVQENITGARVIRALSKTDLERERFDGVNTELADAEKRVGGVMAITNPLSGFILNIGLTLVILAGAHLVNAGRSAPGTIIAFLNYFAILLNAMLGITRIFVVLSKGVASAERVSQVLSLPEDLKTLPVPKAVSAYHVEFRHVSFSYSKSGNNLTDVSFALRRGETLGILGSTGSGKTTVVNLLMRLYDPDSGQILIDGEDIRSLPRKALREKFGTALHNDFIAADAIAENIRYYRDIPDEQIMEAAECAQAMDFINEKADKMGHRVSVRGSNLSGGQKQRLLIARALAGNPEILVLDDSSSALDYRTDANLRKALREHYGGTTAVIVAQRISSIKSADHLLVLDEGRVIGYGTHEELMNSCEVYQSVTNAQMGSEGGESLA